MPRPAKSDIAFYVRQIRMQAGFSQKQLGLASKTSERTVQRWETSRSGPNPLQWVDIVRAIHSRDRVLAASVASEVHLDLVAMGLESPPTPVVAMPMPVATAPAPTASAPAMVPSAPAPVVAQAKPVVTEPEPPRYPEPTLADLARIPLCKAAEVAGLSPSVLRPVLKEALVSMRELGLSLTDVIAGLSK